MKQLTLLGWVMLLACLVGSPPVTPVANAQQPAGIINEADSPRGLRREEIYRPGYRQPLRPDFLEEAPAEPAFRLPSLPALPSEETNKISVQERIYIKEVILQGVSVFTDEELQEITKNYEDRFVSPEELQELRHKLTLYYVDHGYINSGVIIPDQKVREGVVAFVAIEGRLKRVEILGDNLRLRDQYIRSRLEIDNRTPLNINTLRERVLLLHQNSLIKKINAELTPGLEAGEAILRARVEEESPYSLITQYGNNRSPSVGSERGEIYAAYRNVTGWGDTLGLRAGLAEGSGDYTVHYQLPINRHDTVIKIWHSVSDSEVIEEPFTFLDIESESKTSGMVLTHPLVKTGSDELNLSCSFEQRHSITYLLGRPFSFSPGVQNGESDVTVLRFFQDVLTKSPQHGFAVRNTMSIGIKALDATNNATGPDGSFLAWLSQLQWARRLDQGNGSQVLFRTDIQWTRHQLLPVEKFAVGGASSVRGYRENQFVRDNGISSSGELRIPSGHLKLPWISRRSEDGLLQLSPFIDYGRSWNVNDPGSNLENIASFGVGLLWDPSTKLHARIYVSRAMNEVLKGPEHDLQDSGIHFLVSYTIF